MIKYFPKFFENLKNFRRQENFLVEFQKPGAGFWPLKNKNSIKKYVFIKKVKICFNVFNVFNYSAFNILIILALGSPTRVFFFNSRLGVGLVFEPGFVSLGLPRRFAPSPLRGASRRGCRIEKTFDLSC